MALNPPASAGLFFCRNLLEVEAFKSPQLSKAPICASRASTRASKAPNRASKAPIWASKAPNRVSKPRFGP